jgi:L-asparagine oxygenase
MILARRIAERDAEPVPTVDGHDAEREIRQFVVVELAARLLEHFVRHMAISDARHGFRPRQRGAFALGVERRFAPRVQRVEPLLGLADGAQVFPMHVYAVRAAIDLRHAQLDQVEQLRVEAGLTQIVFQSQHGLHSAGTDRSDFDSWLHNVLPFVLPECRTKMQRSQLARCERRVVPGILLIILHSTGTLMIPREKRSHLNRDGFCVLGNVEVEKLLDVANALGRPELDPRDRILIKDIRPQPKVAANINTLSSRYGMGAFPVHTEAAYLPSPPRFLLLYCMKPGSGGRKTVLMDARQLFTELSGDHPPGTWVVKAGRSPFLCKAIWWKSSSEFGIRYDRECLFPAGPAARSEEKWIHEFIAKSAPVEIQWTEGQLLIIDNCRVLHGRGGSKSDDRDRWLKRILIREEQTHGLE